MQVVPPRQQNMSKKKLNMSNLPNIAPTSLTLRSAATSAS